MKMGDQVLKEKLEIAIIKSLKKPKGFIAKKLSSSWDEKIENTC